MHIQIHIGLNAPTEFEWTKSKKKRNLIKIFHLRTHNLIETCRLFFFLPLRSLSNAVLLIIWFHCLEWLKAIKFSNWCDKCKSKIFNLTFVSLSLLLCACGSDIKIYVSFFFGKFSMRRRLFFLFYNVFSERQWSNFSFWTVTA